MEERLREIERRLAYLEEAVARLLQPAAPEDSPGITLPVPVRLVNAAGTPVIELSADGDGGLIRVNAANGKVRIVGGCGPDGGWIDVIQAGSERLAITLYTDSNGGTIEYTERGTSYLVEGQPYWPPEGEID